MLADVPTETPGLSPSDVLIGLGGLLVWTVVAASLWRRGGLGRSVGAAMDTTGLGASIPGGLLILGALAAWSAQPVGAIFASAIFGSAPSGAPRSLADLAIGQVGGYIAAMVVVLSACALVPGLWQATGAGGFGSLRRGSSNTAAVHLGQAAAWFFVVVPAAYAVGAFSLWCARQIARWRGTDAPDQTAHETLARLTAQGQAHDPWWWATIGAVVLGAPLIEEFIYRGLLQQGVKRLAGSAWRGMAVTSALFALAHVHAVEAHALPTLLVLGLGFGWAREKTGSLWVPILMHTGFNAMNVALAV